MKLFWPGSHRLQDTSKSNMSSVPISNCGPRTVPSTVPKKQQTAATNGDKPDDIIEVSFRYTALIAMCLGFLFIWSAVISSIFIKNNFEEQGLLRAPIDILENQERIGQIMFAIGQEMLFTVDALVSVQLNLTSIDDLTQSVNFTWTLTDNEIDDVRDQIDPPNDLVYLLSAIESKLALIRYNLSLESEHPLNMITSYKLIFDLVEQFSADKVMWHTKKNYDTRWHLLKSFCEIQNAPYALFIRGMNRRFIEMSYGTIYHIGPQMLNYTDAETEISNYFYYVYSSHELIENAFAWDPRIHHRYIEMLKAKHHQIFYDNSRHNLYRQTGREYTRFVNDVVAFLLNAKDLLNGSFREVLLQFNLKSNTTFYVLIAVIYFSVLIGCMIFFVLFVRNARIKSSSSSSSSSTIKTQYGGVGDGKKCLPQMQHTQMLKNYQQQQQQHQQRQQSPIAIIANGQHY